MLKYIVSAKSFVYIFQIYSPVMLKIYIFQRFHLHFIQSLSRIHCCQNLVIFFVRMSIVTGLTLISRLCLVSCLQQASYAQAWILVTCAQGTRTQLSSSSSLFAKSRWSKGPKAKQPKEPLYFQLLYIFFLFFFFLQKSLDSSLF